jgi:DNA-binding IclR family transcriptional regulator
MVKAAKPVQSVTVQSVERAIAALRVFFEEAGSVSVTEMVARTGLAPATVHRLLSTLVKAGWVEQDSRSSRYELSEKMLGNAALAVGSSSLVMHGHQFLTRVTEATGLSSYLAVLIERGSVLLARVPGKTSKSSDFRSGRTLPLHASASGKLFLAYLPLEERRAVLRAQGELKRITPKTVVDLELLEEEFDVIRERGWATDRDGLYEGYLSAAVPVRKAGGRVVAALCCGGWPSAAEADAFEETILRELIPAAEEFSRVFGQFEPW